MKFIDRVPEQDIRYHYGNALLTIPCHTNDRGHYGWPVFGGKIMLTRDDVVTYLRSLGAEV